MIESILGAKPAVVTLPIGSEDNFQGIIDLVAMKAVTWTGEVHCCIPSSSQLQHSPDPCSKALAQTASETLRLSATAQLCCGGARLSELEVMRQQSKMSCLIA